MTPDPSGAKLVMLMECAANVVHYMRGIKDIEPLWKDLNIQENVVLPDNVVILHYTDGTQESLKIYPQEN